MIFAKEFVGMIGIGIEEIDQQIIEFMAEKKLKEKI